MIGLPDVLAAAQRIAGAVHRTPVLTSRTLDDAVGAQVWLKAENLQRGGAFKLRGATNRIEGRSDDERDARRLAPSRPATTRRPSRIAARRAGLAATIVMPEDAPAAKLAATRGYGAEVVLYDRYGGGPRGDRRARSPPSAA